MPLGSTELFGDDIRKRIQDITAASKALSKSAKSSRYKHANRQRYSKNFQAPHKYPTLFVEKGTKTGKTTP